MRFMRCKKWDNVGHGALLGTHALPHITSHKKKKRSAKCFRKAKFWMAVDTYVLYIPANPVCQKHTHTSVTSAHHAQRAGQAGSDSYALISDMQPTQSVYTKVSTEIIAPLHLQQSTSCCTTTWEQECSDACMPMPNKEDYAWEHDLRSDGVQTIAIDSPRSKCERVRPYAEA